MSNIITVKIDLNKVDEKHIFNGRNGARYLDIVLMPSRESKYGETHMAVQSVSKEMRDNGVRGAILGNATERGVSAPSAPAKKASTKSNVHTDIRDEDVPF